MSTITAEARMLRRSSNIPSQVEEHLSEDQAAMPVATVQHEADTKSSIPTCGRHSQRRGRYDSLPAQIGRYQVQELLGTGGTGTVYRAWDPLLRRAVALKILHSLLMWDAESQHVLLAEARVLAKFKSALIVSLLDYGEWEGAPFLVLEYIPGRNLASLTSGTPVDAKSATRIIMEAARGVQAAHAAGILHGDLKPANIVSTSSGEIRLIDFDMARDLTDFRPSLLGGQVAGTPSFMSPEQCRGEALDERTDIYALGATYFSLLTGRNSFAEDRRPEEIMFQQCRATRPDPREIVPNVPEVCAAIIRRAMAIRKDARYATVTDFLQELEHAQRELQPALTESAITEVAIHPTVSSTFHLRGNCVFAACVAAVLAAFAQLDWLLSAPVKASAARTSAMNSAKPLNDTDEKHAGLNAL